MHLLPVDLDTMDRRAPVSAVVISVVPGFSQTAVSASVLSGQ